ncbi:unnamed protein product [Gongylonema pulchrum]|uniref:MD-2-related lipid-recognition domain-containing protein n=1 Tax=Gongylonema pulchrum TaxID=637853 RepID=A0A3P7M8S1_9BILA|nr:unnamed protein product [Gongylonema pulchrum]
MSVGVKLWLWTGDSWMQLPIFGLFQELLKNVAAIKLPVNSGMRNLEFTIDLRPLAPVTFYLPSTGHYKIELQFREEKSARNSCLVIETLAEIMLVLLAAALILLFGVAHASIPPPNDVSTRFNWSSCNPDDFIKYYDLTVQDIEGKDVYPVPIREPFVVDALIDNTNGPLDDLTGEVKMSLWTGRWMELPNFGFLNELLECGAGIKCPVESGKQNLEITVDLAPLTPYTMYLPRTAPYKIEFQFREGKSAKRSCLVIETLGTTA